MFHVKVTGLKELNQALANLPKNLDQKIGGEAFDKIGNESVHIIKNNILAKNLIWRNTLYNSVQVKRMGNTRVSVVIAGYASEVDQGHGPTKSQKVVEWAYEKIGDTSKARKAIKTLATKGAVAHPFIEKSKMEIQEVVTPIVNDYTRKAVKASFKK